MNEYMNALADNIARLRKGAGMTQEELAQKLSISFQAISKWENKASSPDIAMLPKLADLFSVSIDALFGRQQANAAVSLLSWENDGQLHAAVFRGHEILKNTQQLQDFYFSLRGEVLNVHSHMNIICGSIAGNACAEANIECKGGVAGDAHAGHDLACGDVEGDAHAGHDLACGDVEGDAHAGNNLACGDVEGNVYAGNDLACGDVAGNACAGTYLFHGDKEKAEFVGGSINCHKIYGNATAARDIICDVIEGSAECYCKL